MNIMQEFKDAKKETIDSFKIISDNYFEFLKLHKKLQDNLNDEKIKKEIIQKIDNILANKDRFLNNFKKSVELRKKIK